MSLQQRMIDSDEWVHDINEREGVFEPLRAAGHCRDVTPHGRLYEMFLKRLYGHKVTLTILENDSAIGEIGLLNSIDFDLEMLKMNDYISDIPFKSSTGVTGMIRVEWDSMVLRILPDMGYEPVTRYLTYTIVELLESRVERHSDTVLEIGVLVDMVRLGDMYSHNDYPLYADMLFVELLIENLEQSEDLFSRVSDVTGISSDRLDALIEGSVTLEDLTYYELSILKMFGVIKSTDNTLYEIATGDTLKSETT